MDIDRYLYNPFHSFIHTYFLSSCWLFRHFYFISLQLKSICSVLRRRCLFKLCSTKAEHHCAAGSWGQNTLHFMDPLSGSSNNTGWRGTGDRKPPTPTASIAGLEQFQELWEKITSPLVPRIPPTCTGITGHVHWRQDLLLLLLLSVPNTVWCATVWYLLKDTTLPPTEIKWRFAQSDQGSV